MGEALAGWKGLEAEREVRKWGDSEGDGGWLELLKGSLWGLCFLNESECSGRVLRFSSENLEMLSSSFASMG